MNSQINRDVSLRICSTERVQLPFTVAFFCLLSILTLFASSVRAHEVSPAIVDMAFKEDRVSISLEVNAEAILAGIDLAVTTNTDDADN